MLTSDALQPILDKIAVIERTQKEILQRLEVLAGNPRAHLTRVQFAKLAGISRWTVRRKIEAFEIRTEKGRIPYSELRKFTT